MRPDVLVTVRRSPVRLAACVVLTLFMSAAPAAAQEPPPAVPEKDDKSAFTRALTEGALGIRLNYRFEVVEDDAYASTGLASTLRTSLAYTTGAFHRFRVFLEAENVTDLGADDQHDDNGRGNRGNDVDDRPVIADPSGTDFLEAGMEWSGAGTLVRAGRQEIILDNARFVGNVGWRQHHQSFRAFRARNASLGRLTFQYAFVDRVYRVFGDRQETATHLINAQYGLGGHGTLTAYAYLLRYQDEELAGQSTDSFGAEIAGRIELSTRAAMRYEAEYATQSDAGDNPLAVAAEYVHARVGFEFGGFAVTAAYEKLGGSAADGQFNTPMATLHPFNGWADKFLATPTDGLQDFHVVLDGPLGPMKWTLRYHDFQADGTDARYGTELDFELLWRAPWEQGFAFTGALYDADTFSQDTRKFWLHTNYSF